MSASNNKVLAKEFNGDVHVVGSAWDEANDKTGV